MTNNIKNIIQIADIHIRPINRHLEYQDVFKNLYDYLKTLNKNDTIVCICGDIFHSKDKLLSETIVIYYDFIYNLSILVDKVYIILGNHDLFKSINRYDMIYGISYISSNINSNIEVIRSSSIITYKNLDIVVSAINDSFIDFNSFKKSDTFKNNDTLSIHLYHGIVHKNNESFMGNVYKKESDFIDFDLTLLGDLHEHHFVDNTKKICYSGSLIQQNFKESLNKGIVHHFIEDNKINSKFIPIKNNTAFYTFFINSEGIVNKDFNVVSNYKYVNIRLLLELDPVDCTNQFLESITSEIKEHCNVVSITKQFKNIINKINTKTSQTISDNLESLDTEYNILNNILDTLTKDDSELKKDIIEYHNTLKKEIKFNEELVYTNNWSISCLEFENVFIYGNNYKNKIEFKDGIIGILGNNAIGKSCILHIIIYALFGYINKTKNVNNKTIINKFSKTFHIKLTIIMNNINYSIIRKNGKVKIRKSGNTLEEQVAFFKENIDLTCSTKTDTEKLIKETLGITNKDDFIFTNIVSNVLYKNIITMSNSELDDTLTNLFNTKIYKELFLVAKTKLKDLQNSKIEIESKISSYTQTLNSLSETNNELSFSCSKSKLISQRNSLIKDLNKINKELLAYKDTQFIKLSDTESYDSKIQVYENKLIQYNSHLNEIINSYTEDDLYKIPILKNNISKYDKTKFVYNQPESYDSSISYQEKIDNINNFINHNNENNSSGNIIDLKEINNLKKTLKNKTKPQELSIKEFLLIKSFFNNYIENCKISINEYNKNIVSILEEKLVNFTCCLNYSIYQEYLNSMETYNNLLQYKNYIDDKNHLILLQKNKEKSKLLKDKTNLEDSIKKIDIDLTKIELIEKHKSINTDKINVLKDELNELQKNIKIIDTYKNIVSDKYLPKFLLEQTIKQIQTEANEIIFTMCNLTVSFETFDTCKWNILIHKNDMNLGVQQCSGFENFIINVALKIIFDKYKFYSGIKMFFIDEGLDCVSEENYDKLDELFELLKTYYKTVIIISHNETLKSKIEHSINIQSDFICSKIV